jgi:hypothetical protein
LAARGVFWLNSCNEACHPRLLTLFTAIFFLAATTRRAGARQWG